MTRINEKHQTYIDMAQAALKRRNEGVTDADQTMLFKGIALNEANEVYQFAKGARQFAHEANSSRLTWPTDEYGHSKHYSTYPDGKTDVITDATNNSTFSATTVSYSGQYDSTPNSIVVEYWNPSTEYIYDENGNCVSVTQYEHDEAKYREEYGYNEHNQLTSRSIDEDADGIIDERQEFTYCHCGSLETATSINDYMSTYEKYDSQGRVIESRIGDAKGNYSSVGIYTYDDYFNRLTSYRQTQEGSFDDLYQFHYGIDGELSAVTYDNKFTDTFKGFIFSLFADFDEDETFLVE